MTAIALPTMSLSLWHRWNLLDESNPDFPVSLDELPLEFERMSAVSVLPQRPVLVLAGWHAWRVSVSGLARLLHRLTGGPADQFHAIAYPFGTDLHGMARRVVQDVEKVWPTDEPHRTREIDVVAISMGGLVARVAAQLPLENGQKRLRVARLFTLATPHRGAKLASTIAVDAAAKNMKPGSEFLNRLNAGLPTAKYELVCYARLRDSWVGATNAAPPGRQPYWLSGARIGSHVMISTDPRIQADIARRLRGEAPLALATSMPPRD